MQRDINWIEILNSDDAIKTMHDINISFEEAYSYLQEIVNSQENTNISLEDSIKNYKLGKSLVAYCEQLLDKAKHTIEDVIDSETNSST
jgi:exodeoxyribonuclease VII small subunit